MVRVMLVAAALLFVGGCMRVKGVVEEAPGRPSQHAIFSVGRPDGIAIYATHHVNAKGEFDFKMSMTDENDLYVYDGRGDPVTTLRRINQGEISTHMKLLVPRGRMDSDMMTPEAQ